MTKAKKFRAGAAALVVFTMMLSAGCAGKEAVSPPVPADSSAASSSALPEIGGGAAVSTPPAQQTPARTQVPAVSVKPLKNSGSQGKFSQGFLALQKEYNLAAVPTYDGYNQSTHPKMLYFPGGWNGYRYWMSITPYPYGNDDDENPCIVVSNDAKTWLVPKGLKNPVTGTPQDVKLGAHYSDSHLVMHGNAMELWYRYNRGNPKTKYPDESIDYYYRITSVNGVSWTKPQLMQSAHSSLISLAANYENGRYEFWFTNFSKQLMHATSTDGVSWQNVQPCSLTLPKGYMPWHQDVIHSGGEYYLLQTGIRQADYSFALFLSESSDGLHFTNGVSFYPSDSPVVLTKTWLYRSTLWAEGNSLRMMVSYRLPGHKWYLTPTQLTVQQWRQACELQKAIVLKAPASAASSPQKKVQGGASSRQQPAPRTRSAVQKKAVAV